MTELHYELAAVGAHVSGAHWRPRLSASTGELTGEAADATLAEPWDRRFPHDAAVVHEPTERGMKP